MEALKAKLQAIAAKQTWNDDPDFDACDWSGGKFDECYYKGLEDGETITARELLKEFFPE